MGIASFLRRSSAALEDEGPILSVRLELHPLDAKRLGTRPAPVFTQAVVDTGARYTIVDERILRDDFRLVPSNVKNLGTPAGDCDFPVFACSIHFIGDCSQLPPFANPVLGGYLTNPAYRVFLGRDFLLRHVLYYDGTRAYYSVTV